MYGIVWLLFGALLGYVIGQKKAGTRSLRCWSVRSSEFSLR